jgi:hypothetical protein
VAHGYRWREFDCDVTPNDLADPTLARYVCTIVSSEAVAAEVHRAQSLACAFPTAL